MQVSQDGSPLQLYYAFDKTGKRVVGASLGFYYSAQSSDDSSVEPSGEVLPISEAERTPGWIRLDFDPSANRVDVAHYYCHLHTSISDEMRIPVTGVPTPKQFVDLILCWFYPEVYRSEKLGETGSVKVDHQASVFGTHLQWDEFNFEADTFVLQIPRR